MCDQIQKNNVIETIKVELRGEGSSDQFDENKIDPNKIRSKSS